MATVGALVWGIVRLAGVRRVEVAGRSMVPALEPGDRLLAVRAARLQPGALVVIADPREAHRDLVKRVVWAGRDGTGRAAVWVEGDNPEASTDSRTFGSLPRRAVLGQVVWRYAPPGRAGRLRRKTP